MKNLKDFITETTLQQHFLLGDNIQYNGNAPKFIGNRDGAFKLLDEKERDEKLFNEIYSFQRERLQKILNVYIDKLNKLYWYYSKDRRFLALDDHKIVIFCYQDNLMDQIEKYLKIN